MCIYTSMQNLTWHFLRPRVICTAFKTAVSSSVTYFQNMSVVFLGMFTEQLPYINV